MVLPTIEPPWLAVTAVAGAVLCAFLCELALAWAATALVDAEIGLGRLSLFALAGSFLAGGAYFAASFPLNVLLADMIEQAEPGKFPWTLFAIRSAVGLGSSLVVVALASLAMLGIGLKRSVLVGVYSALLRLLLYSLLIAALMVVLASLQIYRGPSGPKTSGAIAPPGSVIRA